MNSRFQISLAGLGLALAINGQAIASHLQGHLKIDGQEKTTVVAKQPALLTFELINHETGVPEKHFEIVHEKPMHLFIVSEDLWHFAHVHPALDSKTGQFSAKVNEETDDPDNQDLVRAVPAAGNYFVFSEVKTPGREIETIPFEVKATGSDAVTRVSLDPTPANRTIVKYFKENGSTGEEGDAFRITLRNDASSEHAATRLVFQLEERTDSEYQPVTELQPWLGMAGHALLLSVAGKTAAEKVFRHLHPDDSAREQLAHRANETEGEITFRLSSPVPSGVYKTWAQFKYKDRILTFPFVIQL